MRRGGGRINYIVGNFNTCWANIWMGGLQGGERVENKKDLKVTLLLLLLLSHFSHVQLCATPWTATHQASLSMGFSRQEHWSGLPFPSPMHESGK